LKTVFINKNLENNERSCACIGYFDAFHLGHQKLIEKTIRKAEQHSVKSALICFEPDPFDIISGVRNPHLFSFEERKELAASFGIDLFYVITFDKELMNMPDTVFIDTYLNRMNLMELVCGFDFSFGYKGKGNPQLLSEKGEFKVNIVDEYRYDGAKVSSTRIKKEVKRGNLKLAERLLGHSYFLYVSVLKTHRIGSEWLVETVCDKDKILPPVGIYENIEIKDDRLYFKNDYELKEGTRIRMEIHDD